MTTDYRFTLEDAKAFRADIHKRTPDPVTTPRKAEEARALTVGGDLAGIIPTDYRSKMLGKFDEANLISKIATRVDMGTEKVSFPLTTTRPTTTIDAETAAWTPSDPTHVAKVLTAKKLRCVTICSNEWLADSTINGIDHIATLQMGSMAILPERTMK